MTYCWLFMSMWCRQVHDEIKSLCSWYFTCKKKLKIRIILSLLQTCMILICSQSINWNTSSLICYLYFCSSILDHDRKNISQFKIHQLKQILVRKNDQISDSYNSYTDYDHNYKSNLCLYHSDNSSILYVDKLSSTWFNYLCLTQLTLTHYLSLSVLQKI